MRYAALLRGVNVGKSVKVPMASLRSLMEDMGFRDVVTYLNSGNVIFSSELPKSEIKSLIENGLAKLAEQQIPVLIKSSLELDLISSSIPTEWQNDELQKTDVAYLFKEADTKKTLDSLPVKREFIDIRYVKGALFWNVSRKNYNKSQINKIMGHKMYEKMTIRNINTARKLATLTSQ